jgi:hypothetical protein
MLVLNSGRIHGSIENWEYTLIHVLMASEDQVNTILHEEWLQILQ